MLDSKFRERYFKVYDVLNLLIPYQELLEDICKKKKLAMKNIIFFEAKEQSHFLESAGFKNVSAVKLVYTKQAISNVAYK